ncbi:MAG: FecR domain-containing protein [Candidatus Eremiobacteraeota bacterium]|nr:FecR domain-containing protein [Candidatus Eremiobacteraeota bacterium]
MKGLKIAAVAALCALPSVVAADTPDKQLQNVKGNVAYQAPGSGQKPIAQSASVALTDQTYAITGSSSVGEVVLGDSSVVTIGETTKVQLAFFNQAQGNNAKFIVYNGTTRFKVRHPQGGKANYVFVTPTAQIAVRGTEGDIGVGDNKLQVNVYELCDPNQPVAVTTNGGQHFQLVAGKSLIANVVNGVIKAEVQDLTAQLMSQFTSQFGVPALGQLPTSLQGAVSAGVGTALGSANVPGSDVIGNAVGSFFAHKKATPSPSPSPDASSCS